MTSPSALAPISTSLLSFDGTIASVPTTLQSNSAASKASPSDKAFGHPPTSRAGRAPSSSRQDTQQEIDYKKPSPSQIQSRQTLPSSSSPLTNVFKSAFVQGVGWASQVKIDKLMKVLFDVSIRATNYQTFIGLPVVCFQTGSYD